MVVQSHLYVVQYRHVFEKAYVLESSRYARAVDLYRALARDVLAVQQYSSVRRLVNARQHIEYRGLARAVRAYQPVKLPLFYRDVEFVNCAQSAE